MRIACKAPATRITSDSVNCVDTQLEVAGAARGSARSRLKCARWVGLSLALTAHLSTEAKSEAVIDLSGARWAEPALPGRHTTFVASFDAGTDADFARGHPGSGGFGMAGGIPGEHGQAVQVMESGGHLHFEGQNNLNLRRGTLAFRVRADAWKETEPTWFFEARGAYCLGVRREGSTLSLVLSQVMNSRVLAKVDVPAAQMKAGAWHSILASWDGDSNRGWIALNGQCVSGPLAFPPSRDLALLFYVAGGHTAQGGMNGPGLAIDDLVIYDQPLPQLQAATRPLPAIDQDLLPQVEAGARRALNAIADLQRWGGWPNLHSWPTMVGALASQRERVNIGTIIQNDKSCATPYVAARFLYAYELLGDERFLDVALRAAEFLLAAQFPDGSWAHQYDMTVSGVVSNVGLRDAKFQDSVQSHPIYFLTYLHRVTGDPRYQEAVRRAGEFYLAGQNPNGSWSHHWDRESKVGRTATKDPRGGELNDLCINDAIDSMVLLYHLTGDTRYLRAAKRAGDWLVRAQLTGATVGWADQYDEHDQPLWARSFEPPSWDHSATLLAAAALVEVYRLSGDEAYLQPVRDALAWLETRFPDGDAWYSLDPATGRPVAAWEREIRFLDEPGTLEWFSSQPTLTGYTARVRTADALRRLLENADRRGAWAPTWSKDAALAALPELGRSARRALADQNEAGVWVRSRYGEFIGSLGSGFRTLEPKLLDLLQYIEAARIAAGELQAIARGNGDILRSAYPGSGWYDVPWKEATAVKAPVESSSQSESR